MLLLALSPGDGERHHRLPPGARPRPGGRAEAHGHLAGAAERPLFLTDERCGRSGSNPSDDQIIREILISGKAASGIQ